MAELVLYHHAQGLTEGMVAVADELRAAGHTVHVPDLMDGRSFETLDDGIAYAQDIGFGVIMERGVAAADELRADIVYAGFSIGAMPAQRLAQTRAGAGGALLFHACLPTSEFGEWPPDVPVQVHGMDSDPFFAGEGDIDAARDLAASNALAELFIYEGNQHLFADPSLPSYEEKSARLLMERVLAFLAARS